MHIAKTSLHGNPNIGLFGIYTQGHMLIGEKLRTKDKEAYETILQAPITRVRIAGTELPGVMCVQGAKHLLVPSSIQPQEEHVLAEIGIVYTKVDTTLTCLGNTIVCSHKGAIISTEYSDEEAQQLRKLLGVPIRQLDIAGLTTPGAVLVINGDKGIIHRDASDEEIAIVEKTLGVELEYATVNLGSPHLRSGILHTPGGLLIGDLSGGPEITHIDEALGYMETSK